MSSSLILQQCPACLVRLTWIVFVMGGRWPYSWCFVGVLPPGLVQNCSQRSCIVAVKPFLHPFSSRLCSVIQFHFSYFLKIHCILNKLVIQY